MLDRFKGADGRRLLEETLTKHRLVGCDAECAKALADVVQLIAAPPGTTLLKQDAGDNDLYFIVSGTANVYVNERHVATRGPYESIGEMAIVDAAAPRSATVTAGTEMVVAKVPEAEFVKIANRFPNLWRNAASVIAERLRQRAQFHRPPNKRPLLFIGCSTEVLPLAEQIHAGLKHDPFDVQPWTNNVFRPSSAAIESLEQKARQTDFAALLLSPDDTVISRDEQSRAPRDNVVFELGLFMGAIGRDRTYLIHEHGADIKIPTDLLGITPITYVKRDGTDPAMGPVCSELRNLIKALGVR